VIQNLIRWQGDPWWIGGASLASRRDESPRGAAWRAVPVTKLDMERPWRDNLANVAEPTAAGELRSRASCSAMVSPLKFQPRMRFQGGAAGRCRVSLVQMYSEWPTST
jgi:hypothetical protein